VPCGSCLSYNLNSAGEATVTARPGVVFHYLLRPIGGAGMSGYWPTIGNTYFYARTPAMTTTLQVMPRSLTGLVGATLGVTSGPDDAKGWLAGVVRDCDARLVGGVELRVYDALTGAPVNQGALGPFFFDDGGVRPPGARPYISDTGGFGFTSVPAEFVEEGTRYRVEAWGRLDDGSVELELLACETAVLAPFTATILELPPLREESPMGCFR